MDNKMYVHLSVSWIQVSDILNEDMGLLLLASREGFD
jgi:hypothetical protein